MPHTPERPNPADLVRASQRFQEWGKPRRGLEISNIMADERHYTPLELAEMWGVSVQTIRELCRDKDGVLKIGSDGSRTRRAYKTLRIPHSVAERVHTRLSC